LSLGYSEDKIKAIFQRLALALVTESIGGYIYANDGSAYNPNLVTPWNTDKNGVALPVDVQHRVSAALRVSLDLHYDKVGHNGRSTGPLQQVSVESNLALDPNIKWGWSTIPDTMNPAKAALMFVKELRVTQDSTYLGQQMLSPIIADVLRVQRPLISEVASNYNQDKLDWAIGLAANPSSYYTK
jgi:hypothetical protein